MRAFQVEEVAQAELEEAAAWYEEQAAGLGDAFIAEVKRVLLHVATHSGFVTAPIAHVERGVVRREFVERFPYNRRVRRDRRSAQGSHDRVRIDCVGGKSIDSVGLMAMSLSGSIASG